MLRFIERNEIWVFFCSIVAVNAAFVWAIANHILPRGLYSMGRFALLAAVLSLVVYVARGGAGLLDLIRPMARWRVRPCMYLVALVWGAFNATLVLVAKGIVTGNGLAEVDPNWLILAKPWVLFVVVVGSFVGEIVWVGYAIRQLSARHTPYVAALIVGFFWTMWWMPMVVYNVGVVKDLPLAGLMVNQMGVAVMCAFFYWHTKSGLVVLVMQMAFNLSILIFPVAPVTGGIPTFWVFAVTYFLTALAMFLRFGPRPLFARAVRANTVAGE